MRQLNNVRHTNKRNPAVITMRAGGNAEHTMVDSEGSVVL